MNALHLQGKLGVETISPVKDCCVDTILAWRPQTLGQKHKCLYCDNAMKTIQAAAVDDPEWTGMLNETRKDREEEEMRAAQLWFSKKKFVSASSVSEWCTKHGVDASAPDEFGMAYRVSAGSIVPGTDRAVWAGSSGVLSILGVAKMTTDSMASGGMLHPQQGGVADSAEEEEDSESEEKCEMSEKCDKSFTDFDARLDKIMS